MGEAMPETIPGTDHAPPPGPTFAVAFGGGGARGLAHIHVIRALDELGIRPVAIAGSSIGAMMGAAMAAGMRGSDIEDHARAVLSNRGEAMTRMWRSLPRSVGELVAGGIRLGQFDIGRILRAFMPEPVPQRIEDMEIPLQVTATDFYGHDEHVFAEGDLFTALAASAALPAIFRPVSHEGRLLIDGGITNPVPFDLLHGKADIVIGVDVVGGPMGDARGRPSSLDLLMGASQIMMEAIVELKLRQTQPHILLRPPVAHFGVLDFLKVERVLGETSPIRDELKREIDRASERHLRRL
ncbi:MAG: patatin-like phospholipase family protein [Aquamicrobium sp.]|uniref:patatin-like phospholipase family protein n=1 Tax=Aquamicrobium sp. TaxID=1872579 RepID=UPI00349E6587|nr:patatin-like phospholipase family protein [Aquamicrobium sp.]